ncbi:transglycosylase SLT domain-containing protein [Aidingimonas lacisalsi]|uniref:transglycosylase SLT domain-containing protein n=1 Tax=Aidingimonas lacisalsi TaxID=2604086 RepID=UPI001F239743|nr:transglycosylase SLT domain-containing protein [Aidingimonas lacisalsi]
MRGSSLFGRWYMTLAGLALCLPLAAPFASASSDSDMREALDAARQKDWSTIDQAAIEDHELAGYVAYHRLRDRLPTASASEVQAFIDEHSDSPLSRWMRNQAITAYGKAQRYDRVLAISDVVPDDTTRRCHYYRALLERDPRQATEGGRQLWLSAHSQPSACDSLFQRLMANGTIDDALIWERMMLAWQAGEAGLMSYLERQLGSGWQTGIDAVERVQNDYTAITRVPTRIGPDGQGGGPLFAAAMYGFTRADTEAALEAWRKIARHVPVNDEQRQTIERDLAFYSMVRDVHNNRAWVDQVLPRLDDQELLTLRVREALANRHWRSVIDWIHRMPDEPRQEARWQYWLGRALEELGDPQTAETAYAAAAVERNFYGFAAADRLERPYSLNLERTSFNDAYRNEIADWPQVQRTEALMRIGEPGLANSEWFYAIEHASPQEARALADYAANRGWFVKMIQTTIQADLWDALDWRFPSAYRDQFLKWGRNNDVDPYLLMGIARRESAFNPRAASPAGARGLMQLMPGTATHVSRKLGIGDPGPTGLENPEINIRLGSAYISEMLERYRDNRLAATAAYNAGPGRVDRWLRNAPEEFDLFVESIPFSETRNYVQAVMAYRVIFESLANGGETQGVAMMTPRERDVSYSPSLLARQ